MKGDRMARRSSFGKMVRKRLSDITNFQPQANNSPSFAVDNLPHNAKDYIDSLVKENMAMAKLIQDKNKIIEMSGLEIQHLRDCLQKMQLQNWNLAQSNSHMLGELHMGRERMKALQHEAACKEALLKTNNSSRMVKEEVKVQETEIQEPEAISEEPGHDEYSKCCSGGTRRRLPRTRSLGSSIVNHGRAEKEAVVITKRQCLRRQSAATPRARKEEEPNDQLFEIDDAIVFPVAGSTKGNGNYHEDELEAEEARRTSIGRPTRKAVGKVGSYKEKSINVKMRRSG